jgi:pimeloyl-ACP methyl ester carboxylesterase
MAEWFLNWLLRTNLFPAPNPPTYSLNSISSPPLYMIHGTPCLWFEHKNATFTILYMHDNSVDLGMIRNVCYQMARQVECNVLAIEYPGYGINYGTPSPSACVRAALLAYNYISSLMPVVLMGRSLGAAVAATTAYELRKRKQPIHGLVLLSGFYSLEEAVEERLGTTLARLTTHIFNTAAILQHIKQIPLMIIHGDKDAVFSLRHATDLYKTANSWRKLLIVIPGDSHSKLSWTTIYKEMKDYLTKNSFEPLRDTIVPPTDSNCPET